MKDLKDYLEQTNTVLLTKDAFELLKERASVLEECEDAISRQAVLDLIYNSWKHNGVGENYGELSIDALKALPPVTPKQKMGRWIESDALLMATNEDGCMKFPAKECSVCHKPHIKAYWMDYCPNCGAKMVESEDTNGK